MCLSISFAAGDAVGRLAHAGVSCAGTWIFVARMMDGTFAVLTCLPVTGATAVAFPKRPEHDLVPCSNAPCITSNLEGMLRPHDFVHGRPWTNYDPDEDMPMYRSGGTQLAPLQVHSNPDGGVNLVVPVAPFVKRGMTAAERHALTQPMLDCILDGLAEHDIPRARLFGDAEEPWELVHLLQVGCAPECDVVIGLAAEGSAAATHTFLHTAPATARTLPFLGQVHGDRTPMQAVDEKVYLVTNDPALTLTLKRDAVEEDDDAEGFDVVVDPNALDAYAHTSSTQEFQLTVADDMMVKVKALLGDVAPGPLRVQDLKGYDLPRHTVEFHVGRDAAKYNSPQACAQRIHVQDALRAAKRARH